MTSAPFRGQLTTWNDERGFGFITPENDSDNKSVFIHISVFKGLPRRPVVGDIICYDIEDNNGKIRAVRASIEGIPGNQQNTLRHHPRKSDSVINTSIVIASFVLILMIGLSLFVLAQSNSPGRSPSILTSITKPGCVIKGNISINNGNRYYHLPGMEDYDSTVITPSEGERWFCTEAEAISQGWRKAPK